MTLHWRCSGVQFPCVFRVSIIQLLRQQFGPCVDSVEDRGSVQFRPPNNILGGPGGVTVAVSVSAESNPDFPLLFEFLDTPLRHPGRPHSDLGGRISERQNLFFWGHDPCKGDFAQGNRDQGS